MKEVKYGECRICGNTGKLSYEHVPPRSAFNSNKAFMYLGKEIIGSENFPWDLSGKKGRQLQKGIGFYTLCEKCNNNTGHLYGSSFVEFTYQGYKKTSNLKVESNEWVSLNFTDIYPLRIIKQIIAMFLSVNSPGLPKVHTEFRDLLLSKEKKGLSEKKFGLYIYILRGAILRYVGIGGILFSDKSMRILSEISAPPFGYVLEINPKDKSKYCDITFFANQYEYNEKKTITLNIPILENNSIFPTDYRTREQIMHDYISNQLYKLNKKAL